MRASLTAIGLILLLALTSACGLKGDLYLPEAEASDAEADNGERDEDKE